MTSPRIEAFAPQLRLVQTLAGGLGGCALWALFEVVPDIAGDRVVFALAVFVTVLFVPFLLSAGAIAPLRAALAAIALSAVVTALSLTASLRFATVSGFVETGHPIVAIMFLTLLPVPFLIAGLGEERRWLDYAVLFDAAWAAAVRAMAALAFLGAFWLFLFLSDALLALVEIELLDWLLDAGPTPFILSGAAVGLGLSAAGEMPEFVSPHLPLRLLRFLVLPAFAVIGLFVAMLPVRGLSGLFGTLSTAAVLLAMLAAVTSLVSAALDRDDAEAPEGRILRGSVQALVILMPVLAALAIYAIVERVGQHGWSPDRLAAMSLALVGGGYAATYFIAVLLRRDWMRRIRLANIAVAIGIIALSAAWLSPLLNPQRLAVASQIGRYANGAVAASELDLWVMRENWGLAGKAGIARLNEMAQAEGAGDPVLAEQLAVLDKSQTRAEFENWGHSGDRAELVAELRTELVVYPPGSVVPDALFDQPQRSELQQWSAACARRTVSGQKGCSAVLADLLPDAPGSEILVLLLESEAYVRVAAFHADGRVLGRYGPIWLTEDYSVTTSPDLIDQLARGAFSVSPSRLNVLRIGDSELIVLP